jgi:hypothetical protein
MLGRVSVQVGILKGDKIRDNGDDGDDIDAGEDSPIGLEAYCKGEETGE